MVESSDDDAEVTVEKCRFVEDHEGENTEEHRDRWDTKVQSNNKENVNHVSDEKNAEIHCDVQKKV